MKLIIVESPTKAKTLTRFLGKDFRVESSFGHVRDLPKSKMGVDVEQNFTPHYVIPTKARKRVTTLKNLAAKAEAVYLAPDEDREGEAIAWHLAQLLGPRTPIQRITFHEITKEAILHALDHPRDIDPNLVNAQQARRVLDRLVGYELSPFLWKKVYRGLSAGRVQSVVVRLIAEREREIQAFKIQEYWTIDALLQKENDPVTFPATLHSIDGKKIEKLGIQNKAAADTILHDLAGANYTVENLDQKERQRAAHPPSTTSTLQQDANNILGFSAKQTMMLAQQLYEGVDIGDGSIGLITYMRTDSLHLAEKFIQEASHLIQTTFGATYAHPTRYKTKSKGAQEAHEAIRPTDVTLTPTELKNKLEPRQWKLYDLIWRRAVASQMASAKITATTVDVIAQHHNFRCSGSQIRFDGWLKIYPEKMKENVLPLLKLQETLHCMELHGNQHFTEPPARYTEASMVKALEERGIGRPSTYAPTIATVQERGYVRKEQRQLIPEEIGLLVNDLLVEHFPEVVDYDFTAKMEDNLDAVADGKQQWQPLVKEFYQPFKEHLTKKDLEITKKDIMEQQTDEVCAKCGKPMVIKIGRFGKFLACTGYPECKTTKPLDGDGKPASDEPTDMVCEKCGAAMVRKHGRFGPFFGCSGYPACKNIVNIEKTTGVRCDKCGKGDIIEKRSKRGKIFYACNRYPECQNAYWSKPTGEHCPQCSSLLVFAARNMVTCSNKECKYKKSLEAV